MTKEKTKTKKNQSNQKNMLKEALSDINKEIVLLNRKKIGYKKAEKEIKKNIQELAIKEALLMDKKKKIEQEKENTSSKLSKVQKIKLELSEV